MHKIGNFIDRVIFNVKSGKGGAGSCHFHREKFIDKGGPDGGNGGKGGDIVIVGNKNISTLLHLRYRKHIFAENGENGGKNLCFGANGKDAKIEVPLGTVIKNADTNEFILEIINDKENYTLLKGGKGGLGNAHFKSSVNQTPKYFQPGEPAQELWIEAELKMLAEVGLVGMPNAGKSTLLSILSAAKPKIANYPFTTLIPQLGIVKYKDSLSFSMADIPGIIEGAAEGKGLGLNFLRHIQRNSVLLFLVSIESENILEEYKKLLYEIEKYDRSLLMKKRLLVITKIDIVDEITVKKTKDFLKKSLGEEFVMMSSATRKNLANLLNLIWEKLILIKNTK